MNYESYRISYFVDPAPQPRFAYAGIHGATLFFSDYGAAVAYYSVLSVIPSAHSG